MSAMKIAIKSFLITLLFFILLSPLSIFAHPGRTDSGGGHTCRTNCTKWGLSYGEYHDHSSSRSTKPDTDENDNEDNNWVWWVLGGFGVYSIYSYLRERK